MAEAFLLVLDASLRSTVLLVLVSLAAWLWRRGPAAGRHRLWMLGLSGMLIMPLVVWSAPAWSVRVRGVPTVVQAGLTRPLHRGVPDHGEQARFVVMPSVTGQTPTGSSTQVPRGIRTLAVVSGVWFLGVAVLASSLLMAWLGTHRLRRRAEPVRDHAVLDAARHAARQLGLPRLPPLLFTEAVPVPLVCGWLDAAVLLPTSARDWPELEIRAALLHELAHVKRRDGVGQLASALVLCIYWFHPGSWMAARTLAAEREVACDELVLRAGIDPLIYADQLLAIASRSSDLASPRAAMAMARPRGLERRLHDVLRWVPRPRTWHRRRRLVVAPAMGTLIVALGALRLLPPTAVSAAAVATRTAQTASSRQGTMAAVERPAIQHASTSASVPTASVPAASSPPLTRGAAPELTLLRVPTRKGVCGAGVPNEITFSRATATSDGALACRTGPALLALHVRNGVLEDVSITVGETDARDAPPAPGGETAARLLAAAVTLPPDAAARAAQAAALIEGPDVSQDLLALARRAAVGPAAQRMSVVWAEIVGGTGARAALLSILRDESVETSVREQVIIALGSTALPTTVELARASPDERMRRAAAHRAGLALPVDELLRLYATLPDAEARQGLVDRVAERGTATQRERLADLIMREPDEASRTKALTRLRRS